MSLRVLLADDHAPMRAEIRDSLEATGRFQVCAEVGDSPGAVDAAVRTEPDICLLDIRMPGSGLAAAWEITARLPETRVVMLTVSQNDNDLFGALRAGAAGYLLKDSDTELLAETLDRVVAGEPAISSRLLGRLVSEFRDRAPKRRAIVASSAQGEQLTSREWEVLNLLREEKTTAEIASELVLSQATVRSHIAAILRKLRVADRAAAIRLFQID